MKTINKNNLQALVDCEVVEIRGVSGVLTTVDVAMEAPGLTRMHAMSGEVYEIVSYTAEIETFNVKSVAA